MSWLKTVRTGSDAGTYATLDSPGYNFGMKLAPKHWRSLPVQPKQKAGCGMQRPWRNFEMVCWQECRLELASKRMQRLS